MGSPRLGAFISQTIHLNEKKHSFSFWLQGHVWPKVLLVVVELSS